MKKAGILFLFAVLILQGAFASEQAASISSFSGNVEYRTLSGNWEKVERGMELPLGTTVSTGFRSTLIMTIGNATLTVGPLSRLSINELAQREGVVETELFLEVGRVTADVKKVEGLQNEFSIDSPITTASVRGTVFSFDSVNLTVNEGVVLMTDQYLQTKLVWAGETASGTGDEPPLGEPGEGFFYGMDTSDIAGPSDGTGNSPDSGSGGLQFGTADVQWTFIVP